MENRTDHEQRDERLRDDTAGRTKAEAALAASEEQFRMFVGGVKDYVIFLLDPGGVVASWNPGAERIKGYKAEEIHAETGASLRRVTSLHAKVPSEPWCPGTSISVV